MKQLLVALLIFACAGCVRQITSEGNEHEHDARLSLAQDGDGMVTFSWNSRKGYVYRLYKFDKTIASPKSPWVRVESAPDYKGTGETMEIKLQVMPGTRLPLYSIRGIKIEQAASRKGEWK